MKHLCVILGSLAVWGCIDRPVSSEERLNSRRVVGPIGETSEVDILVVVDDSLSTADKQQFFASSLFGGSSPLRVCFEQGSCIPLTDSTHMGFISSSLEAAGGDACTGKSKGARLLSPTDREQPFISRQYPEWDASEWLSALGENGCGFEAPLEAMYRFLIDPSPPKRVVVDDVAGVRQTVSVEVDRELLAERATFLRPRSSLVVIVLTDEDDCSLSDSGDAYKVSSTELMARPTSTCEQDPNDPCCRSCDDDSSPSAEEEECVPLSDDPACTAPSSESDDALDLRCFEQRRRFGKDWRQPVSRYVDGLSSLQVVDRDGRTVPNPLFAEGRDPAFVSLAIISGAPWQLLMERGESGSLTMNGEELETSGGFVALLGNGEQTADPHVIESIEPRPGLPLPDAGYLADEIIGHEFEATNRDRLQHSCIFEIEPRQCTDDDLNCECSLVQGQPQVKNSPLCQDTTGGYGPTQRFAGARPSPRLWQLARALGKQAFVGSVCPADTRDDTDFESEPDISPDLRFGYRPTLNAVLGRAAGQLRSACEVSLNVEDGYPTGCVVIEAVKSGAGCDIPGREPLSGRYVDAAVDSVAEWFENEPVQWTREQIHSNLEFCEVQRTAGSIEMPDSDTYSCAHNLHPREGVEGWCWISPKEGIGNAELTSGCPPQRQSRVRVLPAGSLREWPFGGSFAQLLCID